MIYKLNDIITRSNTGLDAIRRAPIVERETGIKCIRITDISQKKSFDDWGNTEVLESDFDKFQLKKEDILIARTGATIGVNRIITEDLKAVYNNGLIRIQINKKIANPRFVYYSLNTNEYWGRINAVSSGTVAQPNMKMKDLLDYELNIPSIDIQNKIVKVLKNIDDRIELNNEINDNLMQQGTSLFNEYIVKFDDIPSNWKLSSLDRIADYINGLAMQKYPPKDNDEGLPVLKIAELKQGCCDSNSDRCTSQLDEDYIINDGEVIFSWSASLVVDLWCGGKAGLNQHLFNVKSNIYDKWFYFWWTKYHLNEFIHEASSKATTMGHIKRDNLSKAKVLIPSKNDYEAIGRLMKPITDSIVNVKLENKRLSALRDSLLPKLMSGEIDVDSIEL